MKEIKIDIDIFAMGNFKETQVKGEADGALVKAFRHVPECFTKVHVISTKGMNGREKNEDTQGTNHRKIIVLHKGGLGCLILERVNSPPTYNFSMEKEIKMSEI